MDDLNILLQNLPPPYKNDNIKFEKKDKKFDYEEGNILNDKELTLLCIIPYSTKYTSITNNISDKSFAKALNVFEDYKNIIIDLCNPKKTLSCKVLAYEYMLNAKDILNIDVDPFPDPHDDIKYMISGSSPFKIVTNSIIQYNPELSFIENMFIQTIGTKIDIKPAMVYTNFYEFGFKNYIKHKIPLKRVINGAITCYCDPFSELYYVTQLVIDKYTIKILKNLLIYGRENAKLYYIESAIKYIRSMCSDEEDYKLMKEYGIILHINGNYNDFIKIIKELEKYMVGFVVSSYWKWHYEMIRIANYKESLNNDEEFKIFAKKQYSISGILSNNLDIHLYKNLT
jgi:hypothetical protein